MLIPADEPGLMRWFEPGAEVTTGNSPVTVRVVDAGQINLATGQVVVTDPFTLPDWPPLAQRVPPGEYPVTLGVAHFTSLGYGIVAAAMVRLADGAPVSWFMALNIEQDPAILGPDEIFGFPVDAGTAAFLSPESAQRLMDKTTPLGIVNVGYLQEVSRAMGARRPEDGQWVNLMLDADNGLNGVLFQSGYGDGYYTAYWGYDDAGNLVCLVTDFGL
jgi:hypothetical protein